MDKKEETKKFENNKAIKKNQNKEKVKENSEDITQINKIFQKLMHFPASTFSDLWEKDVPSNKFTYYLKKMEKEGLIEKKESKYYLTIKGKKEAATIDGETGKTKKRPYVALLLIIKKEDKYILYKRMKEPYYGNCGFAGAKLEMGESILDGAKRELKEETGLICDGKIIGVQNIMTLNNNELFAHMVQYLVLFENPKGELIKESREGTYSWEKKETILSQKNLFPDIPLVIKDVEEKRFKIKEVKVIQENEKFVDIKVSEITK